MRKTNIVTIKVFIFIVFASGMLFGCVNTEGIIEIKGKVIDECTSAQIPRRDIIVQGLVESDNKLVPVTTGQFTTDSTGCFTYELRKIKDALHYNFCLVGDSDYASITKEITLFDLEKNAKYLSFSLSKLADLTINFYRKSKTPVYDTLFLSWQSNEIDGRFLYPYKIINYELMSDFESGWVGGKVKSTIKTRTVADTRTTVRWVLFRNGKVMEFIDTITCKRDFANNVYFTY
jgi:hypothetical protein